MKNTNVEETGVIQIFVPTLPNTPGWVKLDQKKKEAILLHTSHIQQYRQMQRLGEFGELVEAVQVHQLLEGEEMTMADYLRVVYPDQHQRTILRKVKAFSELAVTIPNSVLKRITFLGEDVLSKFDRIRTAALGDIRNALREMPLLPVSTDHAAEKYLEELDTKLAEERKSRRRKGLRIRGDEEMAVKMAVNALLHYINGTKLKTSAEKRQFFKRVMGYALEAQGVPGTLQITRVPIPDGILIRRGRPIGSKTRRKEAA